MKKTKDKRAFITLKGKDFTFKARVELSKAYLILADIEKTEEDARKLKEKHV